jgi:hypothetical protein
MSSIPTATNIADLEEPECKINEQGDKYWYLNGQLHRKDGPAIDLSSGTSKYHREDGAAYIDKGGQHWYRHGLLHRIDGPAIELVDGTQWWFIDGIELDCETQEEFEQLIRLRAFW